MSKLNHGPIRALVIALLLGPAGCSILAPQKDQSQFFILTPASADAPRRTPAAALQPNVSVGLGPVTFPGY
jgi:hypothetical protein